MKEKNQPLERSNLATPLGGIGAWLRFGVWLGGGFAHMFLLLAVVVLTLPSK